MDKSLTSFSFLKRLVEMLEYKNENIIRWFEGVIYIQNPPELERHILSKYYGHSKYTSFQRQLTNFGFYKISGRGKMASCRYKNNKTSLDINSILSLKRITSMEGTLSSLKPAHSSKSDGSASSKPPTFINYETSHQFKIESNKSVSRTSEISIDLDLSNFHIVNHLRAYARIEKEFCEVFPRFKPRLKLNTVDQLCRECCTDSKADSVKFQSMLKSTLASLEHAIKNPQR